MIRYALVCEQAHEFESWFPSSDAYDAQVARGLVTCPICNSGKIEKQIMAPSVARTDKVEVLAPLPAETQNVALLSEKEREIRAMLKAVREHVTKNAENVGEQFPEVARKMHLGEIEHRSIYGEASLSEAKALIEEGIEIHPLPIVPDERN